MKSGRYIEGAAAISPLYAIQLSCFDKEMLLTMQSEEGSG